MCVCVCVCVCVWGVMCVCVCVGGGDASITGQRSIGLSHIIFCLFYLFVLAVLDWKTKEDKRMNIHPHISQMTKYVYLL